jgi:hypothetical protein
MNVPQAHLGTHTDCANKPHPQAHSTTHSHAPTGAHLFQRVSDLLPPVAKPTLLSTAPLVEEKNPVGMLLQHALGQLGGRARWVR